MTFLLLLQWEISLQVFLVISISNIEIETGVPWCQISMNYSMWFMVMEIIHTPAKFHGSKSYLITIRLEQLQLQMRSNAKM